MKVVETRVVVMFNNGKVFEKIVGVHGDEKVVLRQAKSSLQAHRSIDKKMPTSLQKHLHLADGSVEVVNI